MVISGRTLRVAVTLAAVAAAAFVGWRLWVYYLYAPWTRDARVLANIAEVAPDVSGLISEIRVGDNQSVAKGDVLFVIDRKRFEIAVDQARAVVAVRAQALKLAQDTATRDADLRAADGSAISVQAAEETAVAAAEAEAELQEAQAALAAAEINLTRSEVRSPVNGYVTNLTASVGDYATTGQGVVALVDEDSFYVYAYFMETKLPAIRDGAPAAVRLLAGGAQIGGTVEGVSRAIADPNASSADLLANVNPAFDWIRLAQRIPVRIRLGPLPPGVRLISGMTATVTVTAEPSP